MGRLRFSGGGERTSTNERTSAGREQTQAEHLFEQAKQAHCAEVAERGGVDMTGISRYPPSHHVVELDGGTVSWVQAPATGADWSAIMEFDARGDLRQVHPSGGALLLPTQAEIDKYRDAVDETSTTRPAAHSLNFNVGNIKDAANRSLGEPVTREDRIAAIWAEADRRYGPGWQEMPGPDHPDFRERELSAPWSVRVPEYRYTLVGAVLGAVRVASLFVPLLGGEFRRWETRHMYRQEMYYGRNNTGGAFDPHKGPNKALLATWQSRHEVVQEALRRVDGEDIDLEPRLRNDAERNALAEAYADALRHTPKVTAAMSEMLADMANERNGEAAGGPGFDWTAPDPLLAEEAQRASARPRLPLREIEHEGANAS